MKTILLIIVTLAILISGCTKELACNKPYIQVGADCCLDQNNNQICDNHEEQKIEEPRLSPERCALEQGLACVDFKASENDIQLGIANGLGRDIKIHTIKFKNLDCARTFDVKLFSGDQKVFVIPCTLAKGERLDAEFTINYFERDKMFTNNGGIVSDIEGEP